jgi:hypothetical protein
VTKKRQSRKKTRSRRRQNSSLVIPAIVVVVVLAIVVGAILSMNRGQAATGETSAQGTSAQPLNTSSLPFPDVPRISVQETQNKMEQGLAILVDVRSKTSYDRSHAVGAISLPEAEILNRLDELPRDKDIILYCT